MIKSKGRQTFDEAQANMQAALAVIDPDEAEELIGEKPEVLNTLLDGIQGATVLHWMTMQRAGAKKNRKTLNLAARNQMVLMQMMVNAFAAGIEYGRARKE